jgi:WD40 repeat protein
VALASSDPESLILAAGDKSGRVKVWDAVSGSALHAEFLRGHHSEVHGLALEYFDGYLIVASGSEGGTVFVQDVLTGNKFDVWHHERVVTGVALAKVGQTLILATGSHDHTARIVNALTNELVYRGVMEMESRVRGVSLHPHQGQLYLAIHEQWNEVQVWNLTADEIACSYYHDRASDSLSTQHPSDGIFHAYWAPRNCVKLASQGDKLLVASGGPNNIAKLWDVLAGKPVPGIPPQPHGHPVLSVTVSPGDGPGLLITGSNDHTTRIWDPLSVERSSEVSRDFPAVQHKSEILSVSFQLSAEPQRLRVFSCSSNVASNSFCINEWFGNALLGMSHADMKAWNIPVLAVSTAPYKGAWLVASHGFEGRVVVWNARNTKVLFDKERLRADTRSLGVALLAPDDERLALAVLFEDGSVQIWDPEAKRRLDQGEITLAEDLTATRIALGTDEKSIYVILGGDRGGVNGDLSENEAATIAVWNISEPRPRRVSQAKMDDHGTILGAGPINLGGRLLPVSFAWRNIVRFWDLDAGGEVCSLQLEIKPLAIASDARSGNEQILIAARERDPRKVTVLRFEPRKFPISQQNFSGERSNGSVQGINDKSKLSFNFLPAWLKRSR